jgi:uncharacterized protein (DUF1330 family)
MTVCILSRLTIHDRVEYEKYEDQSEDYQAILKHRNAGSTLSSILVKSSKDLKVVKRG